MGADRPPDLVLPRPPRWPAWALATSVALHGLALVGLLLLFVPLRERRERHLLSSLTRAPGSRMQVVVLPPSAAPAVNAVPIPAPARASGSAASVPAVPLRPFTVEGVPDSPIDQRSGAASTAGLAPSLQSGVLWDRREAPPARVGRTHAQLTDSAAKAAIRDYLDSLAALPNGGRILPPSWKGTIGGREYGLDAMWVTVAGVKIPALLLGLIPLPAGGNESKALDKSGQMRAEDYRMAMPRDAIAKDQQAEIRKIRERQEAERDLNRKQGEAP